MGPGPGRPTPGWPGRGPATTVLTLQPWAPGGWRGQREPPGIPGSPREAMGLQAASPGGNSGRGVHTRVSTHLCVYTHARDRTHAFVCTQHWGVRTGTSPKPSCTESVQRPCPPPPHPLPLPALSPPAVNLPGCPLSQCAAVTDAAMDGPAGRLTSPQRPSGSLIPAHLSSPNTGTPSQRGLQRHLPSRAGR